jgi:hypothetical protein
LTRFLRVSSSECSTTSSSLISLSEAGELQTFVLFGPSGSCVVFTFPGEHGSIGNNQKPGEFPESILSLLRDAIISSLQNYGTQKEETIPRQSNKKILHEFKSNKKLGTKKF